MICKSICFIVKDDDKSQTFSKYFTGNRQYYFTNIDFIGDIDGDDKMDYILCTEGEQGYNVLFLSSEKKENNLVEPVAHFYTCYCC
jgi:hypothetical protein